MSLENFVPQLSRPTSVEQLARSLGVAPQLFNFIAENTDPEAIYRRHLIPKRAQDRLPLTSAISGLEEIEVSLLNLDHSRCRVVWEARNPIIKHAHKSASRVLERYLSRPGSGFPHSASFGYVRKRSTRHNAKSHVGAKHILSADIKDFFPSITLARVELALQGAGLNRNVCNAFAKFLTIDGTLPLGLNASPVVANFVATPLDFDFSDLAKEYKCVYTRYADDITFSGNGSLPSADEIEKVLMRNFFRLNRAKFRTSKRGQKHYVTGLSVADKSAPHVPRAMKRKLRQEIYYIGKFGFEEHFSRGIKSGTRQHNVNRLDGSVSYVASVEPKLAGKIRSKWDQICKANDLARSFEPRPSIYLRNATWFVDESEILHVDGTTRLLALCLVDVLEIGRLDVDLVSLFAEEAGDAFGTADALSIISKGLHWVDASWNQRDSIVKLLSVSPIRAFVAMEEIKDGQNYEEVYARLLGVLLETNLKTSDDAEVSIYVEENRSKVSADRVNLAVLNAYRNLEHRNHRRPLKPPSVHVVPKGYRPSSCVPDIFLGVLSKYARSKSEKKESVISVTLFERLRNRYALIIDGHANKVYHHRNSFIRW